MNTTPKGYEEELMEKFENQSFIRVMKQASDFNKHQYELMIKMFLTHHTAVMDSLKENVENEVVSKIEIVYGDRTKGSYEDKLINNVISIILTN